MASLFNVPNPRFGWAGPALAFLEWERLAPEFRVFFIEGPTERRRTCAWDCWETLGFDINRSLLYQQQIGDCVSFGGAIALTATLAYEIVRLGEAERFKIPYPPYLYGISRLQPEGGNGRLRGDGSLGSWLANTIVKYGVLRADYEAVPDYSGGVAKDWGASKQPWRGFIDEADNHLLRRAARLQSVDQIIDAICNGYYATIASMRGYEMQLAQRDGKSWFQGTDSWPHQMSFLAFDDKPVPCLYRRNQWGNAHGTQLDGPDGGGWVTCDSLTREVESEDTEVFAYSMFDGWPSDENKPRNWYAGRDA